MKKLAHWGSLICLCAPSARAQFSQTFERTNGYFVPSDTFSLKLKETSYTATLDRFGSQTEINWIRNFDKFGYGAIEHQNSSGRDLFERAILNGVRETAADWPGAKDWEDWAEGLYVGTVGNTTEENLHAGSATPNASEDNWWRRNKSDGVISYGLRPIDGEPYGYANVRLGRLHDQPLLILHGRIYYRPFDEMRTDLNFLFSLSPYGELSGGISVNPLRIGDGNGYNVSSIRFSHGLFGSNDSIGDRGWVKSISFYAGYSYDQHVGIFECGLHCHLPTALP